MCSYSEKNIPVRISNHSLILSRLNFSSKYYTSITYSIIIIVLWTIFYNCNRNRVLTCVHEMRVNWKSATFAARVPPSVVFRRLVKSFLFPIVCQKFLFTFQISDFSAWVCVCGLIYIIFNFYLLIFENEKENTKSVL